MRKVEGYDTEHYSWQTIFSLPSQISVSSLHSSTTKLRGSASPTSTTSSTSGHSSGGVMPSISTASQGDLSSSPASSVTSGSTRSHKGSEGSSALKKSQTSLHMVGQPHGWNLFKKSHTKTACQASKNENVILRWVRPFSHKKGSNWYHRRQLLYSFLKIP